MSTNENIMGAAIHIILLNSREEISSMENLASDMKMIKGFGFS